MSKRSDQPAWRSEGGKFDNRSVITIWQRGRPVRTYRTFAFNRDLDRWDMRDLEPYVAIAFKRLFARVLQTARSTNLSDTDDVCVKLNWFMLRYPPAREERDDRGRCRAHRRETDGAQQDPAARLDATHNSRKARCISIFGDRRAKKTACR